jgi:TonB family protein
MKKTIYLTVALLICLASFAQTRFQNENQKVKAGFGATVVQQNPEFPGGPDSLFNFLSNNLKYPRHAKLEGVHGRVYVGFLIDKTGKLKNHRILNGVTEELNEEAMRVVKEMPDWKPGTRAGENVDVQYVLPIDFILPKKNEPEKE